MRLAPGWRGRAGASISIAKRISANNRCDRRLPVGDCARSFPAPSDVGSSCERLQRETEDVPCGFT
jgi:hypothetical protein